MHWDWLITIEATLLSIYLLVFLFKTRKKTERHWHTDWSDGRYFLWECFWEDCKDEYNRIHLTFRQRFFFTVYNAIYGHGQRKLRGINNRLAEEYQKKHGGDTV